MYPNKIAIIIRDDLKVWQRLNVAAFLASGLAIEIPELHGGKLVTASGNSYLPFINQPVLLYKADGVAAIKRAFNRAKERELQIGIYAYPLFATMTEEDNLKTIAGLADDDQDLVGIIIYGDVKKVNKAVDGLKFHY